MIIRSVRLKNACGLPGEHDLTLPERGLVVVTGPNGAGKTSLCIDAASAAGWGETTRSARSDQKRSVPPWFADGTAGEAGLAATVGGLDVSVTRQREGGKVKLTYTPGGEDYDTASKAQPGLEKHLLGSFLVWRRTRVFSSTDAVRLSMAAMTDGELKKLVEQLLGCNFDGALEACRKDLRAAEKELQATEVRLGRAEERRKLAKANVEEASAAPADSVTPPLKAGTLERLKKRIAANEVCLAEARDELAAARDRKVAATCDHDKIGEHLGLLSKASCPTCERPITPADRKKYAAPLEAKQEALRGARATAAGAAIAAQVEVAAIEQALAELRGELRAAELQAQRAAAEAQAKQLADKRLLQANSELADASRAAVVASEERDDAGTAVATLTAVAEVLGLKGPRAHIVQHALDSVEATANTWLSKLITSKKMTLRLTAGDAMEVEGAGGGYGYAAASAGQRRRIDFALWLGVGNLAPRHRGGTMLLDEPFDGLDAEGRAAVVEVVQELAAEQCVVLIAHDEALIRALEGKTAKKVVVG